MLARPIISAVSVFFLLVTLSSSSAGQQGPGTPVTPTEHAPLTTLPASVLDAKLKAARGRSFRLSDYSGKVLVVNLWATWVGPCLMETPELVKLHKQFRSQGVEMVGLSPENPAKSTREVRKWVRHFRVHYMIGWAIPEVAATLMHGREAIPQTFVISRTGRIVRRFVGLNPVTSLPHLKLAIEEALNEKPDLPEEN
jgi:peroxiredoxin